MGAHSNMLMIDFETLGTRESAVILSVGLVYFTYEDVGPQFYFTFSLEDQLLLGRTIDDATVNWWIKNEERKKELAILLNSMPSDLEDIQETMVEELRPSLIWSRGCMDFHILNSILGPTHALPFYVHRDVRTLDIFWKPSDVPTHNALADAQLQVAQVQEVMKLWRMGKSGMSEQCAQTVTEISKKMEPAVSVDTGSSCSSGCSGRSRRTHP